MQKTQLYLLARHLNEGNEITPVGALVNFNVARLAARILELNRDNGHIIRKTMRSIRTDDDRRPARYASYRIDPAAYARGRRLFVRCCV